MVGAQLRSYQPPLSVCYRARHPLCVLQVPLPSVLQVPLPSVLQVPLPSVLQGPPSSVCYRAHHPVCVTGAPTQCITGAQPVCVTGAQTNVVLQGPPTQWRQGAVWGQQALGGSDCGVSER